MFHRFANPARFLRLADAVQPWISGATVVLLAVGLYLGLIASPADYQQGEDQHQHGGYSMNGKQQSSALDPVGYDAADQSQS